MKKTELQAALNPEAIYEKSKVYIQRALTAHANDDLDQYQLWASLALELLGKARLAKIHPSLIVDPNNQASMFAASGINIDTDIKTITWKTVFERLQKISRVFDSRAKKFCDDMALRRNAELHSGEVPFKPMLLESWEGRYWRVIQNILTMMDLTLEEWLGADQAKAPKQLVKQAQDATIKAAGIKLEDARDSFLSLKKKEREKLHEKTAGKSAYNFRDVLSLEGDIEWEVTCPACEANAFMGGMVYEEIVVDYYDQNNPWEEDVEKHCTAEEFKCLSCGLHLNSVEEIEAVGLDSDHMEIDSREREFEYEYGND